MESSRLSRIPETTVEPVTLEGLRAMEQAILQEFDECLEGLSVADQKEFAVLHQAVMSTEQKHIMGKTGFREEEITTASVRAKKAADAQIAMRTFWNTDIPERAKVRDERLECSDRLRDCRYKINMILGSEIKR